MRNTDPLDFIRDHREAILRWGGIAAAALVIFLIIRFIAMRLGGWKAAGRRLWREVALTAYAFTAPARAWLRYRRSLRVLAERLGASATWRDAERALVAAKFAAAPGRPYAAVVGDTTVTVLFAAADMPPPRGLWQAVPDDPWAWTAARAELPSVTPDAEGTRPVVVALGERDLDCVFLDLVVGPPMVCVQGDPRSGPALFQAVAAQLDARLPGGQVVVADGVHRDVPGPPVRDAYRTAGAKPARLGLPAFLVTPELPDPLPPELAEPQGAAPSLRVLLGGPGRGHVRALLTDVHGRVAVPGTPLVVASNALGAALARVLPTIPPVLPPAPAPVSRPGTGRAEWFAEEERATAASEPRAARTGTEAAEPVANAEPAGTTAPAVSARTAVAQPPARSSSGSAAANTSRPSARTTPTGAPAVEATREPAPSVDANREPVTEATREPTPSLDVNREPVPSVDMPREPVLPVDANREPVPPVDTNREPVPPVGEPGLGLPPRTSSAAVPSEHEGSFVPAVSARREPTPGREPVGGPGPAPVAEPTTARTTAPTTAPDSARDSEPAHDAHPTRDPHPTPDTQPTQEPHPTRDAEPPHGPASGPRPPRDPEPSPPGSPS
ncbi:hypothetical protein ACFZBU_11395 [Embleya sp. NPDC008237]|uniref:hypothetical protein n=1 Tax=Embleya sp. NPDC008237 TaxID=3363978 RepID=UPI0036ED343B